MNIRALADGDTDSQAAPIQLLKNKRDANIRNSYTSGYTSTQLAIAAPMIGAVGDDSWV